MKSIKKLISECLKDIFTVIEFRHLKKYPELESTSTGLENTVPVDCLKNCYYILGDIIMPLKERFPDVEITSWYRSPEVNKAVGGAAKSAHMTGEAIDFNSPSTPNATLLRWVNKNLKVDYIKVYKSHIHITKRKKENK